MKGNQRAKGQSSLGMLTAVWTCAADADKRFDCGPTVLRGVVFGCQKPQFKKNTLQKLNDAKALAVFSNAFDKYAANSTI